MTSVSESINQSLISQNIYLASLFSEASTKSICNQKANMSSPVLNCVLLMLQSFSLDATLFYTVDADEWKLYQVVVVQPGYCDVQTTNVHKWHKQSNTCILGSHSHWTQHSVTTDLPFNAQLLGGKMIYCTTHGWTSVLSASLNWQTYTYSTLSITNLLVMTTMKYTVCKCKY